MTASPGAPAMAAWRFWLASAAAVVAPWRVTRSGVSEPSVETSKAAFAAPPGRRKHDQFVAVRPGLDCVPVHGESTSWNAVTSSMPMLVIRSGRVPAVIRTVWAAERSPTWTVEKATSPGEIEAVVPPGLTRSQATTAATARTPTASGRSHFADRPPRPVAEVESCSTSPLGIGIASASRTARFCCVLIREGHRSGDGFRGHESGCSGPLSGDLRRRPGSRPDGGPSQSLPLWSRHRGPPSSPRAGGDEGPSARSGSAPAGRLGRARWTALDRGRSGVDRAGRQGPAPPLRPPRVQWRGSVSPAPRTPTRQGSRASESATRSIRVGLIGASHEPSRTRLGEAARTIPRR